MTKAEQTHLESLVREVAKLKKEVNHYHRNYYDCKTSLDDWQAYEYDNDYDDDVANENMKIRMESYKPLYVMAETIDDLLKNWVAKSAVLTNVPA